MSVRAAVIINPRSGRGRARPAGDTRRRLAETVARRVGVDVHVAVTRASGHARELARACLRAAYPRVIAWGGDGTVNEIAGELVESPATLGIVPSGSGDGLARGLGLVRAVEPALAAALTGAPAPIDVGYLGDRHFLNIAGIGFDAVVGREFNRRGRHAAASYLSYAVRLIGRYECVDYRLELDGDDASGRRLVVAFANASQYGNGLVLAADADPADGWLDSVVIDDGSAWRQLWRIRRLAWRTRQPAEGLYRRRVRRASVTADLLICHVDGETFEARGTLEVGVRPGALRVAGLPDHTRRGGEAHRIEISS